MGVIEEIYDDVEADLSLDEFREAVGERVEKMGGLADEETAAMLVAHELDEPGGEVEGVAEIEPGMEEVKFLAKVLSIGEVRSFERDGEDAEDGRVVNVDVADETGQVRITFWDEPAVDAAETLEPGDVLRIKGRPKEGYSGVEVNVDKAEPDPDEEIDVRIDDTYRIEDLSLGLSDVNLSGRVLDTESVRTFDRDDGSEGKVANLALGDPTGRIRVTLWDGMADRAEELDPGVSVEVVDGYVRERDDDLEVHVGERGAMEELDETIEYVPDATPIEEFELGDQVDLVGVARSTDPKRTFDRDDGSQGQVKNVRVQDGTGDIRVALWGDLADRDIAPGDKVALADVEIQDGWQDDLEASANWRSTVTVLEDTDTATEPVDGSSGEGAATLGSFGDGSSGDTTTGADETATTTPSGSGVAGGTTAEGGTTTLEEEVEFTGTVVQAGDPTILDDGEQTVSVDTDTDVHLGEEITVRGRRVENGRIDADDVF